MRWDPDQYLRYADARLRPFVELIDRIGAIDPERVADLGCGPGNATELLLERWPKATVVGIDNSEEMIATARSRPVSDRLHFELGDVRELEGEAEWDVIVSNATLQWVPGHLERFPALLRALRPGGWFAFQVPGMEHMPSHAALYALATSTRWAGQLAAHVRENSIETPECYLDALISLGCAVDVWETTYYQVLPGEDAVLEWTRGSSLRPFITALGAEEAAEFTASVAEALRRAYPRQSYGTVYPFRRVFVVARVAGDPTP